MSGRHFDRSFLIHRRLFLLLLPFFFETNQVCSQDSLVFDGTKAVTLKEVIVRKGIDVPGFIKRVKEDSSFYKAFRNLHIVGYTIRSDIRLLDSKDNIIASLTGQSRQIRKDGCRTMQLIEEKTTGDFYRKDGSCRYYTAELYAGLFFTKGKVCNENNIVSGVQFNPRSKRGLERSKEQLKMLFFNPGKRIPGIPFVGDRINIYDESLAPFYDYTIDYDQKDGLNCYVLKIKCKDNLSDGDKNDLVIRELNTWWDLSTMDVVYRTYHLQYDAGVYDFDVTMEVKMERAGTLIVPALLRYIGNWKVLFKKRERAYFTAMLSNFSEAD